MKISQNTLNELIRIDYVKESTAYIISKSNSYAEYKALMRKALWKHFVYAWQFVEPLYQVIDKMTEEQAAKIIEKEDNATARAHKVVAQLEAAVKCKIIAREMESLLGNR